MEKTDPPRQAQTRRSVRLDQHESVRSHVRDQVRSEVERLERRIETLRLTRAPRWRQKYAL